MGAVVIVGSLGRETAYGEVSGLSCPESWLMPGAWFPGTGGSRWKWRSWPVKGFTLLRPFL